MKRDEFVKLVRSYGGSTYIVGGYVRDTFMNKVPTDVDYCICGIDTETFEKIFNSPKKIGVSFPVYLLDIDGEECEVAFARKEIKIGNKHIDFETISNKDITIYDDLYRRDLTINAIAYDLNNNTIIDPFAGVYDINSKTIRRVSEHFKDDPLRILRAARFASRYNFNIDIDTLYTMNSLKDELKFITPERKFLELKKALSYDKPSLYFYWLDRVGLLEQEFPWIYNLKGQIELPEFHPEGDAYNHSMMILDNVSKLTDDVIVRFAALVHDIGKSLTPKEELPHHYRHDLNGGLLLNEFRDKYKLPNDWYKFAKFTILNHMRIKTMSNPKKIRDFLFIVDKSDIDIDKFNIIANEDAKGHKLAWYLTEYCDIINYIKSRTKDIIYPEKLKGKEIGEYKRSIEIKLLKEYIRNGKN